MTASRRRAGRNVGVRRCQRSRQVIDLAETPASERVAHGYPESMARKIRPGFGEIELQRIAASVAPDDPALAPAGFDNPGVRITPSEIERHFSPTDVATPAVSIQARLTRCPPATMVVVFGNSIFQCRCRSSARIPWTESPSLRQPRRVPAEAMMRGNGSSIFPHLFRDVQGASHLSAIHPRRVRSSSPAASWTQSLRRRHSLDLKPHHCPATFVVASAFLWSA